jgi:hypothetical protein
MFQVCEIWSSHGGEHVNVVLLGCNAEALKMKTVWFSETLVSTYKSTWPDNPEEQYRHVLKKEKDLLLNREKLYFPLTSLKKTPNKAKYRNICLGESECTFQCVWWVLLISVLLAASQNCHASWSGRGQKDMTSRSHPTQLTLISPWWHT